MKLDHFPQFEIGMQKSHWNHHQGMILLGILFAVCDFTYIRIALEFTRLQENEFQEVLPWKTTQYYVYDISRYTVCKQARHIRYAMKMPGILGLQYPPKHNSECFWCRFWEHSIQYLLSKQNPAKWFGSLRTFQSRHAICKKMPNIHPPKQRNNKCVNSLKPEIAWTQVQVARFFPPHHLHNKVIPMQVPEAQTLQW